MMFNLQFMQSDHAAFEVIKEQNRNYGLSGSRRAEDRLRILASMKFAVLLATTKVKDKGFDFSIVDQKTRDTLSLISFIGRFGSYSIGTQAVGKGIQTHLPVYIVSDEPEDKEAAERSLRIARKNPSYYIPSVTFVSNVENIFNPLAPHKPSSEGFIIEGSGFNSKELYAGTADLKWQKLPE